jgi:hypothetical protein
MKTDDEKFEEAYYGALPAINSAKGVARILWDQQQAEINRLKAMLAMTDDQAERAVQGCEMLRRELDVWRAAALQAQETAGYLDRELLLSRDSLRQAHDQIELLKGE